MLRGELAKRAVCSPETVRYYERIELIEAPPRSSAGYRLYADWHLRQVYFIRTARELGFDLKEIRKLLALSTEQGASCEPVDAITKSHLANIDVKIQRLQQLRRVLTQMLNACHGDTIAECGIVDALRDKEFNAGG